MYQMKKKLVLMLVAISVFAMLVTMAASAPTEMKTVRLLGIHFSKNQLMLRFDVTGFTKRTDIRASITVDKVNYPVKCKYDDRKHLTCIAPQMSKLNGLPARLWVAGFAFYIDVPFR
jgi:hypothetical protein